MPSVIDNLSISLDRMGYLCSVAIDWLGVAAVEVAPWALVVGILLVAIYRPMPWMRL